MQDAGQTQSDSLELISSYLRVEFDLDADDVDEMLVDYLANLRRLLGEANAAMDDYDALRKVGHAIKGAAGNLGSKGISAFGKKLEDGAKAGEAKESLLEAVHAIQKQYDALKEQYDQTR